MSRRVAGLLFVAPRVALGVGLGLRVVLVGGAHETGERLDGTIVREDLREVERLEPVSFFRAGLVNVTGRDALDSFDDDCFGVLRIDLGDLVALLPVARQRPC